MKKSDFRILVVDDEASMRETLKELLERENYQVELAADASEAMKIYKAKQHELVISDIMMPEVDGIQLIQMLKKVNNEVRIILITGYASIDNAIQAIKLGAEDYFTKPFRNIEIMNVIERIYNNQTLLIQNAILKQAIQRQDVSELIGNSEGMKKIRSEIKLVADSDISVFISGESGTGKELVARAIHRLSKRLKEPFVPINCAAVPNDLLESEFFGHEKGAFSGAINRKYGLFETADKGTLFLDEIAEMPINLQAKLLRTVETMLLRRIGGTVEISVDFRIVCCTNRDIKKEIKNGNFRSDLFYRLSSYEIKIPPLRERKNDIPLIINHYLEKMNKNLVELPADIMTALVHYDWPGNIRELIHILERICLLSKDSTPDISYLPAEISKEASSRPAREIPLSDPEVLSLQEIEKNHILHVLRSCRGDKRKAAKILEIGLKTLYRKLSVY